MKEQDKENIQIAGIILGLSSVLVIIVALLYGIWSETKGHWYTSLKLVGTGIICVIVALVTVNITEDL